MFASKRRRKIFVSCMAIAWLGLLLLWFRIDQGLYYWGIFAFPFVMIQGMLIAVFCSKAMEEKTRGIVFPMLTELLLISFLIIYLCLMMSWNTPFYFFEDCFSEGLYSSMPTFWIAFLLSFIPIFAFPFLRRRKKDSIESNIVKEDRMFASKWEKKTFARIVLLSWAGLFLPWFSFEPSMEGYVWGFLFFPYFMMQMAVLVVFYNNEPKDELGVFIVSIITELCLVTFPIIYIWQMFTWYTPFVSVDNIFETSLEITYPSFWISLVLAIIPILAFPVLRRWKKDEAK